MRILPIVAALCLVAGDALAGTGPNHKGHMGRKGHTWASDCVEAHYPKPPEILGHWKNKCSYGVNVRYRLRDADGACESRSYAEFPCAFYIPANSRRPGYIKGPAGWIGCKASGKVGEHGPFPMRMDRRGFGCFHLGFGPGQLLWRFERYRNGVFVGEFNEEGRRHGVGQYYWHSGNVYTGEYRNGKRHGHGTATYASGDVYSGQWVNNALKGRTFANRAKARIAAARERERREKAERQRRFEEEMEREEEMNRQRRRRAGGGFMDTFTKGFFGGTSDLLRPSSRGGGGARCADLQRRFADEYVVKLDGGSMCSLFRHSARVLGAYRSRLVSNGCVSASEWDKSLREARQGVRASCE